MADQSEVTALIQQAFPGQKLTPQMVFQILQQNARQQDEGFTGQIPSLRGEVPKDPGQPKTTVPKPVAKAASGGESAPTTKTDVTEGPYRGADVGKGPTREDSPDPTRPVPPRNAGVGVQSDVAPPIEPDPYTKATREDLDGPITSSPTTAGDMSAVIDQAVAPAPVSPAVAASTAPTSTVPQQIPQGATGPQPPAYDPTINPTADPRAVEQFQSMMPDDPLTQRAIAAAAMFGIPAAVVIAALGAGRKGSSTAYPGPQVPNVSIMPTPTTSAPPPTAAAPPTAAPTGPTVSNTTVGQPPAPPPQVVPTPQTTSASPPAAAEPRVPRQVTPEPMPNVARDASGRPILPSASDARPNAAANMARAAQAQQGRTGGSGPIEPMNMPRGGGGSGNLRSLIEQMMRRNIPRV